MEINFESMSFFFIPLTVLSHGANIDKQINLLDDSVLELW